MEQDLSTKIMEVAIRKVLKTVYGFTNADIDRFINAVITVSREIRTDLANKVKKPVEN